MNNTPLDILTDDLKKELFTFLPFAIVINCGALVSGNSVLPYSFRYEIYNSQQNSLYQRYQNFLATKKSQIRQQHKSRFFNKKNNKIDEHAKNTKGMNNEDQTLTGTNSIAGIVKDFEQYITNKDSEKWDENKVDGMVQGIREIMTHVLIPHIYDIAKTKYENKENILNNLESRDEFINLIEAYMIRLVLINYQKSHRDLSDDTLFTKLIENFGYNPIALQFINDQLRSYTRKNISRLTNNSNYDYRYQYYARDFNQSAKTIYIAFAETLYNKISKLSNNKSGNNNLDNKSVIKLNDNNINFQQDLVFLIWEFMRNVQLLYESCKYDKSYSGSELQSIMGYIDDVFEMYLHVLIDITTEEYSSQFVFCVPKDPSSPDNYGQVYLDSSDAFNFFVQMIRFFPSEKAVFKKIDVLGKVFNNFRNSQILNLILKDWDSAQDINITLRQLSICDHIFSRYGKYIADYDLRNFEITLHRIFNFYQKKDDMNTFKLCNQLRSKVESEKVRREQYKYDKAPAYSNKRSKENIEINASDSRNDDGLNSSEIENSNISLIEIQKNQERILINQNKMLNAFDKQQKEISMMKDVQAEQTKKMDQMMMMMMNMQKMMSMIVQQNGNQRIPSSNNSTNILFNLGYQSKQNNDDSKNNANDANLAVVQASSIMYSPLTPQNSNNEHTQNESHVNVNTNQHSSLMSNFESTQPN